MSDVQRRRREGHLLAEKLSKVLAGSIPGVEQDIRFTYVDDSFLLWWGERGEEDTSVLITFDQLRLMNDEELRHLIRQAAAGR
ncbi:MAG: hypothetical protein A3J27_07310 [Candidatus Tectomicrobia bacterium RIFCSPLOWO2_12_FULL_69_37]|nr:MAG: hypothetical protein A3I72_15460 [Candidatus Tectomicrobia bacterium RIFCSPLOWO2_02_FULL_70_19]OGL62066.1 MAG: hypothetical protein A3J27_07310 [Candidatus Tectomicrobia bacterium RIFCSPLOWO2_12_FULL_69_37]